MNLPKLVVIARKIHRFLVGIIILLSIIMMLTGSAMKYPEIALIDPFFARRAHNIISTFFSLALTLMMVTGLFMYLYPWLSKIKNKSQTS